MKNILFCFIHFSTFVSVVCAREFPWSHGAGRESRFSAQTRDDRSWKAKKKIVELIFFVFCKLFFFVCLNNFFFLIRIEMPPKDANFYFFLFFEILPRFRVSVSLSHGSDFTCKPLLVKTNGMGPVFPTQYWQGGNRTAGNHFSMVL